MKKPQFIVVCILWGVVVWVSGTALSYGLCALVFPLLPGRHHAVSLVVVAGEMAVTAVGSAIILFLAARKQSRRRRSWEGPPPPPSDAVRAEMAAGRKIQAIKEYRRQCPALGLREAKDAVEALMASGV